MSRKQWVEPLGRIARGVGALLALVALLAGIPWALWHFVGWPLPHHVPTATQVGRALDHRGIPTQALIDALAVVVWVAWASLVASIAAEVPAALAGRRARRLPVAGVFQPLSGWLIAAIVVAALTLAPRAGAHEGSASIAGRLPARPARPAAAVVLADATAPVAPAILPVPAAVNVPGRAPVVASAASTPSTVYVVQRGDTLWGIAERELGDPLRWSEIYALNEGRPEPGGATLSDPHWIYPGWTLLLPAANAPTPPTPPPSTAAPPSPTPPTPAPTGTARPPVGTAPPTTAPARLGAPTHDGHGSAQAGHHAPSDQPATTPVELPSGSMVAGSFAAGVLATVALGRLRRRRAYRYHRPEPGIDLTPPPRRPTLEHLRRPAARDDEDDCDVPEIPDQPEVPVFPVERRERRLDPGRLEVGTRDGAPVIVELTELSGVELLGAAADDVVRALLAALVVRAGPGAAEVLCTTTLAERLLPRLACDRAVRRAEGTDQLARAVEAERVARTRRLDAADAPDAERFRRENPENPLPALLVLLDAPPEDSLGRWAALVADAARLGITVVFLDHSPVATARVGIDATRTVTGAEPADLAGRLLGARLIGLRADEAVELLGEVIDANRDPAGDPAEPEATEAPPGPLAVDTNGHGPPPAALVLGAWPARAPGEEAARPLEVRMLGPYRIVVFGRPVRTGLRDRAQTLLAWCLLRPEGATIEEIVDALWPDTAPDRVLDRFWHPYGDLRTFCRSPEKNLEVLEKVGGHYRPDRAEIACDLWDFEAALGEAARAGSDGDVRAALGRAVDAYGGDLLAGSDHPWVEPVRQDLHRRAVDAHLRLAELEEDAGQADAAASVLERLIDLDHYAEEPYRRLMRLQAAHGRPDAVAATWRLLQRRLAGLDVDVSEETSRLYLALTTDIDPGAPGPMRPQS